MIRFKITSDRAADALNILEYMALANGDRDVAIRVARRFIVGKDNEYIVKVIFDTDGDIERFENMGTAMELMKGITPKRMMQLGDQILEAVKGIVDPKLSGGGLKSPTSTEQGQLPPGSA